MKITDARSLLSTFANRETLAVQFMAAYQHYRDTTGGTFVEFVRLVEPTLSTDYRHDRRYHVADYLRRKAAQSGRL